MAGCSAESWARRWAAMAASPALSWAGRRDRCLVATTGLPKAGCLAAAMAGCSAESWARAGLPWRRRPALSWAGRRDRCLVYSSTGLPKAGCLAAAMAGCSAESWARRWAAMAASRRR
eukprot:CCRYP_017775-RA/>CCRYP_017775-RA protein AED:0.49 eAED:0.49 QI:0/-1/0/1/-1/1/1/0/117